MGREGRDNVFERRNRDKMSRGRGGQGGGGRNADYHQPYDNNHSGQDQRQISQTTGNNAPTANNTNDQSKTQIVKFQSGPSKDPARNIKPAKDAAAQPGVDLDEACIMMAAAKVAVGKLNAICRIET